MMSNYTTIELGLLPVANKPNQAEENPEKILVARGNTADMYDQS